MTFLLKLATGLWKPLTALWGLVRTFPLHAALIAAVCLSLWLWHGKREAIAARNADHAAWMAAQEEAAMRALAAKAETERRYERMAHDADLSHAKALADARAAAERHIAANRVRGPSAQGAGGATAAAAGDSGAGVPESLPAAAVMVSADDVRACTGAAAYAMSAHEWAAALGR